jgi:hypothetical protein
MHPAEDQTADPRRSRLRRFGPIAVVAAIVVAVVAVSAATSGSGDDADGGSAGADATTPSGALPDGVVTWSMAEDADLDVTFPDTCDTGSGRIAIPFFFRTECIADVDDNGGATATGVTAETVKVVAWLPNDDDPIFDIVRQGLGFDDSADEMRQTYEGLAEIFGAHYQTYGRTVDLEFVQASGTMLDPVAARADAIRAAEMEPFAVIGGPLLSTEWTEELHARGIVCMACPSIEEPAPSAFGIVPTQWQTREHVVAYVTEKLAGEPAEFAGDDIVGDDRVFAMLTLAQNDADEAEVDRYEDDFADAGVELAENISFSLDLTRTQELATSAIVRMKQAGVTTVIVRTDPITLPTYLNEATKQNWYPEWVIGAPTFVDTSTFGRSFDQAQWEHAFGVSFLPPASQPQITPAYQLYEWYFGTRPPADESLLLTYPQVAMLFTGLGYAGPGLTVETFRDGAFAFPPTPRAVTQPSVDYGTDLWGRDDYGGIDDFVEVWWDPEAEGVDETGEQGEGLYRYVDGGRRYLPDEYTDELRVFDPDGAVTEIVDPPQAEVPPEYPSPSGG